MFWRSKRPWKRWAVIRRVEFNDGDVQFEVRFHTKESVAMNRPPPVEASFESKAEAEAYLAKWWEGFWPKQVRKAKLV